MRDIHLFQLALGLQPPWTVVRSDFTQEENRLDLYLDFGNGSTFSCPVCGRECKAYDTEEKTWRHLNFFQHKAYIHARAPRIKCSEHGVKTVEVPWARPVSGFTLLFEAYIMCLAKEMPVSAIARLVDEHDTRIWRVIEHYVETARTKEDFSDVNRIGMDETSHAKGHKYVSVFVDFDKSKVIFATPGKDASTVERFAVDLVQHNGRTENVAEVCCDMSEAFISGVKEHFKQASITFDKFHIMKIINEAVDEVRRQEQRENSELRSLLKGTRYIWLKNPSNLSMKQYSKLSVLKNRNIKTVRAYNLKLAFAELFNQIPEDAEQYLKKWYFWATHSQLEPMKTAAKTIKNHWDGVLRWFTSSMTNGILEGINSLIQSAKRRARGYRTTKNYIMMIYLVSGKLELGPTL